MTVGPILADSSIIICAGSGGVGKTTTAAAIGIAAARAGRRVVVVTIDPAKRLADTLGISGKLGNEPHRIELGSGETGQLWAMMLDTQETFNEVVRQYSADSEQVKRITSNRFFLNISNNLSGTQEYMAAEKLFQLHSDDRFDLVVIDTPPSRDALNFLDAPSRLVRFLDHRVYRMLLAPTTGGLRIISAAMQPLLRTIAGVVSAKALDDVLDFFRAFEGMESGFRARASEVAGLLRSPSTAYVVITSPSAEAIEEADYFISQLAAAQLSTSALIVNRLQPSFDKSAALENRDPAFNYSALDENLKNLNARSALQVASVTKLVERVAPAPVAFVPLLSQDVASPDALGVIATHLITNQARTSGL